MKKRVLAIIFFTAFSGKSYAQLNVITGASAGNDLSAIYGETQSQQSSVLSVYNPVNGPSPSIAGVLANFKYDVNYGFQLLNLHSDLDNLYFRYRVSSQYQQWRKIWHSGNFNPDAETLDKITARGNFANSHIYINQGANLYLKNDDPGDVVFMSSNETEYGRIYCSPSALYFSVGSVPVPYMAMQKNPDIPNTMRLQLNGDIITRKVKVTSSGWADYVFANDYKLPTFEGLEKFIANNGHLPGIPSATTLEKDGLDIGDMQKRQMEKIEELTLLLIKVNKQVEKLEEKVSQQQVLIDAQQQFILQNNK
ncbi:hypothetical protein ACE38W_05815 [Chitinophaga sp. Hz27]|uniref:hypothetical protein n=1 Tax=Chitinophaga sp. Hz27 TaxID=3347169 RepID=UPI0035DEF84F